MLVVISNIVMFLTLKILDNKKQLSASEALYEFWGVLTSLKKSITVWSKNDASIIAELVASFIKEKWLRNPRKKWYK